MASPAQAPQNFNRTHPNHERAHPSGESVGQYHIPTPESADVPSNGQTTEKEKRSVGTYVAIGVGGVALTVAGMFGFGKVVGHQSANMITNGADISADQLPGLENTPETELGIESENRLSTTVSPETMANIERFNNKKDVVLERILQKFQEDGFSMESYHMFEGRTISDASQDMTPVQILDRNSAKNTYLTSFLGEDEALSQIDIAARPDTLIYNSLKNSISEAYNGGPMIADESIYLQSHYFDNGTFYDDNNRLVVSSENTPTQVISAMSQRERINKVFTFQWDQSAADTNEGEWRLVAAANDSSDLGYIDPLSVDNLTIRE